jgi:signal transduction histidine kinase
MQIRTRLTLQFIITVASILALALGFVYVRYKRSLEEEFYRGLRFKAIMTAQMVLRQEDKIIFPNQEETDSPNLLPASEAIAIYNVKKQRVFALNQGRNALPEQTFEGIRSLGECRITFGDLPALGIKHYSVSGNEYVVVAASVFQSEELKQLRNILLLSFFIAVTLVALGGWFFAGQALAPVSRIVDQVERILPSNLGVLLQSPTTNDEIGRLVQTFNRLLDRIYFAFQMQKRFVSNVSHELKNPISIIIAQLEVSLGRSRTAEAYRETMESVLEDSKHMAEITDKLLQMARVYSEDSSISFSDIQMDTLVLQVREMLLRGHSDYTISVDFDLAIPDNSSMIVVGNEPLLKLAISNLIENGCKFSPDKSVSLVVTKGGDGGLVLLIKDKGPGIPAADLPLVFQPFYRGVQQAKAPGSGIGLSLVDSILRLHQTVIEISTNPEGGTIFRLCFPKK